MYMIEVPTEETLLKYCTTKESYFDFCLFTVREQDVNNLTVYTDNIYSVYGLRYVFS